MTLDLDLDCIGDAESDSHELPTPSRAAPERRGEKGSLQPAPTPTPTSSAAPTPTPRSTTFERTEHQIYQRLRLKLVKLFGSMAAALYEMGADPETGGITREQFEETTCGRLGLLTTSDASFLFSHLTYMDVLVGGSGNVATFKDFSISEEEWRQVVSAKTDSGGTSSLPFQSGPSGGSMGLYHRSIRISTVNEESRPGAASQGATMTASRPPSASAGSRPPSAPGRRGGGSGAATAREARTQPAPWQQRQKPWAASSLAGDGPPSEAVVGLARGRPYEQTMRMAREGERFLDQPKYSLLGAHDRGQCFREGDNSSFLVSDCPTRRCEMTSRFSPRTVDSWPYAGPKPSPQLRATRLRLLALSARG